MKNGGPCVIGRARQCPEPAVSQACRGVEGHWASRVIRCWLDPSENDDKRTVTLDWVSVALIGKECVESMRFVQTAIEEEVIAVRSPP